MTDVGIDELRKWLEDYKRLLDDNVSSIDSEVIRVIASDKLDINLIEKHIQTAIISVAVSNGFCVPCQAIFDAWPTTFEKHQWRPSAIARSCSTFELEASTRSGCRFCTFLLQVLKGGQMLEIFRKIELRLACLGEKSEISLCVLSRNDESQGLWLNLPAECYDEPTEVLRLASKWLSSCDVNHESCRIGDHGILPTRLISISGECPRLVLTSKLSQKVPYATLSHCWGKADFIKLTRLDLASYLTEIPIVKLPLSFRDAISITRSLGLEYLWIDSLCIIQNSVQDWQKECALMGSVYGGSTVNIAASSAHDSTKGCFLKPQYFSGGLRARINEGGLRGVRQFMLKDVYRSSTIDTCLGSRAWALQEKLLAPRTIHFSDRGVLWECREHIASEYLPAGIPSRFIAPMVCRVEDRKKWEYSKWEHILKVYCRSKLTKSKDKLPALAGIAKLISEETGDEYLAGLWRRNIEEQLCWWLSEPEAIERRPTWRAPSWSWMSIEGAVEMMKGLNLVSRKMHVRVWEATTTKFGPDKFGQVTDGRIRLACSVMVSGSLHQELHSTNSVHTYLTIDKEHKVRFDLDCTNDICGWDGGLIYLVPMFSEATLHEIGDKSTTELFVHGLVLRPTKTEHEFTRIGSCKFFESGDQENIRAPFRNLLEASDIPTAEAMIDNVGIAAPRYMITLV